MKKLLNIFGLVLLMSLFSPVFVKDCSNDLLQEWRKKNRKRDLSAKEQRYLELCLAAKNIKSCKEERKK